MRRWETPICADVSALASIEVLRKPRHEVGEFREKEVRRHHLQREVTLVEGLWHRGGSEIFAGAQFHVPHHATALRSDGFASVLPFAGLEWLVNHEATCTRFEVKRGFCVKALQRTNLIRATCVTNAGGRHEHRRRHPANESAAIHHSIT